MLSRCGNSTVFNSGEVQNFVGIHPSEGVEIEEGNGKLRLQPDPYAVERMETTGT